MPQLILSLRIGFLVSLICLGGYALAVAQPAAPVGPEADAADLAAPDVEESPLLIEPTTPERMLDAAVLSNRLARPKLAKRYLEQMLAEDPDDQLLLRLREQHGPGVFLSLANNELLRPASTELLERINAAFRRRGADARYLDQLIEDLSKDGEPRHVARITLRNAGLAAVPRLLFHLADPRQRELHDEIVTMLAEMEPEIVPALLGGLESADDFQRGAVIDVLGTFHGQGIVPYLLYPAVSESEPTGVRVAARQSLSRIIDVPPEKIDDVISHGVADRLHRLAVEHLRDEYPWERNDDGTVTLWTWQPELRTVSSQAVSPTVASLHVGTRFARQALELLPDQPDSQSLFLSLALAEEAEHAGWEGPIPSGPGTAHNLALAAGPDAVLDALRFALHNGSAKAAAATLEVIGQIGSGHQLAASDGRLSPVLAALDYPDRRVQFAAAVAVLELKPQTRFPGAQRVVDILARVLNDGGDSACVVVDANVQRGSRTADFLKQLGYDPLQAATGQDGFRLAVERMDVELIALQINTIRWPLSQTVANLRADSRSAQIPIVVYGPDSMRHRIDGLLSRYAMITFVTEADTADQIHVQVTPFIDRLRTPPLTPPQRAAQMAQAASWLAAISTGQQAKIFRIEAAEPALVRAVNVPELSGDVLQVLTAVPTSTAQELLQQYAVSERYESPLRQFAARRLAEHIQRFGLLLSVRRVVEVESSWRSASEPTLATALASVVGSLKPDRKRVGQRLRDYESPRP